MVGSSSAAPLIKGYLPVRLRIPEETFIYVKQHRSSSSGGGGHDHNNDTTSDTKQQSSILFVANCPIHTHIQTKLVLQSIFGRYGDIIRVTVINDLKKQQVDLQHWTTKFQNNSCLPNQDGNGKFAHVVFKTEKDMKQTMKALTEIMSSPSSDNELPAITLDTIERQTLADESDRLRNSLEEEEEEENSEQEKITGIAAIVQRYRNNNNRILSRQDLLDECNNVMEQYETKEEEAKRIREQQQSIMDEDGFITVTRGSTAVSTQDLEVSNSSNQKMMNVRGGRSQKPNNKQRSRKKKKKNCGSEPLTDFYRFQTKETRKRSLQDLRIKFEEDLQRIKKMKDEKKYSTPF